jgi:hypothetical protein
VSLLKKNYGLNTKKPPKLPPVLWMAPQTTSACSPAPQTTNCLFFGPLRQFMPSKWMETESHAQHVTLLARKCPSPCFEISTMPLVKNTGVLSKRWTKWILIYKSAIPKEGLRMLWGQHHLHGFTTELSAGTATFLTMAYILSRECLHTHLLWRHLVHLRMRSSLLRDCAWCNYRGMEGSWTSSLGSVLDGKGIRL